MSFTIGTTDTSFNNNYQTTSLYYDQYSYPNAYLGGYTCWTCGQWVSNGCVHTCYAWQNMPETKQHIHVHQTDPELKELMKRVADALEQLVPKTEAAPTHNEHEEVCRSDDEGSSDQAALPQGSSGLTEDWDEFVKVVHRLDLCASDDAE